jgi:hypothetical protein
MMALLPGYVDVMTAVNNDVGATAVFSVFLWGAVRLITQGVTVFRVAWVAGTAALCVWTKNTASVAVMVAPLALLLTGGPENWRRRTWVGIVILGLALVGVTFAWGDSALWYRGTDQAAATRQEIDRAPVGAHALAVRMTDEEPRSGVSQPLLREDVGALRGRTVTLGAWMWATRPITTRSPMIDDGRQTAWRPVEVGTEPTFQTVTATVAAGARQVEVRLRPLLERDAGEATVYYDGLVLTVGEWAFDDTATFNDADGRLWTWKGWTFVNLLRNGSTERGWPRVRPWVARALRRYARRSPAAFLASVLDWRRTKWIYGPAALSLLKTFWARFGWAHVSVAPGWYWGVGVMTALGVLGAAAAMVRHWSTWPLPWRRGVVCLAAAGLVVWGNAVMRPHPFVSDPLIPAARYAFPAIVPTVLMLMGGWLALVPRRWKRRAGLGLLVGLVGLNVVSLMTIWRFYRGG